MKDTFHAGDTVWLRPSSDFKFDEANCCFGIDRKEWNAMTNRNPHVVREVSHEGNCVFHNSGYYWPYWACQHDEPIAAVEISVEDLL